MTQTSSDTTKCEFCDKRGLPLLLVRDAIAPNNSNAPVSSDKPFALPDHAAHFTRRILRSGFLNVYDEARKRWELYNITRDGYFFKMSLTPGVIPVKPVKPFNCPDFGHRALASCITVSDPAKATKVWIGFSDAIWTNAVRKENEVKAFRDKHMVCIDVAAIMRGETPKHCRPVSQVSAVVAEYAMDEYKGPRIFSWSFHQFHSRAGRAERLQTECDALRKGKGQIVTVPDPSAIVAEVAQLMKRNVLFFNRDPSRSRLIAADTAISSLETGVRDTAILEGIKDDENAAKGLANVMARDAAGAQRIKERKRALLDFTDEERKLAGDKAWEKYAEKFDDRQRTSWRADYHQKLSQYCREWVDPLALKHVALMKSAALLDYLDGNFDTHDMGSGAAYTNVVNRCAAGTQDQASCARLYAEWVEGECLDRTNLLLRALSLNQESLAKLIDKETAVDFDKRGVPWDNLLGTWGLLLENVEKGIADAMSNSIVMFAGAITTFFSKWITDNKYSKHGIVRLVGAIAGRPVIRMQITDKRIAFRKMLGKHLVLSSGVQVDHKKLHQAIGAQLALQGVNGQLMNGSSTTTWIIFVDENIPGLSPGASEADRIAHLLKYLRTAEGVDEMQLSRFRAGVRGVNTLIHTDVKFGSLAVLALYAGLEKLIDDEAKATAPMKSDAHGRLLAGKIALAATTAELVVQGFKGIVHLKHGTTHPVGGLEKLIKVTKLFGLAGALIVATLDGENAMRVRQEGDRTLSNLYWFSAVAGGSLGLLLTFPGMIAASAVVPVLVVLFIAVVAIGLIIDHLKDNPFEDWLERCAWGKLPNQRYRDEQAEQQAYKMALGK